MSKYTPDRWVIVDIAYEDETIQKVFSGNYGGYLGSDTWKLSSGITKITDNGDHYEFLNESGSVYICYKQCYGMSNYMTSMYEYWNKNAEDSKNDSASINIVEGYDEK